MDFATQALTTPAPNAVGALDTITRQQTEMQAMVGLAKKFPRDAVAAREEIEKRARDPWIAENGVYRYTIKGAGKPTSVRGISIVMALEMAQTWGNLLSGLHQVDDGPEDMTMRAFAWDLEANRMRHRSFILPKRQLRSGGKWVPLTDDREIRLAGNNAGSREERNCILKVLPGALCQRAFELMEGTFSRIEEADAAKPDYEALQGAFAAAGIQPAQLEELLGFRVAQLSREEYKELRRLHAAFRGGDISIDLLADSLRQVRPRDGSSAFSESTDRNRGHGAVHPKPADAPKPKPADAPKPKPADAPKPKPAEEAEPLEAERAETEPAEAQDESAGDQAAETASEPEPEAPGCSFEDFARGEEQTMVQLWAMGEGAKSRSALDALLENYTKGEALAAAETAKAEREAKSDKGKKLKW